MAVTERDSAGRVTEKQFLHSLDEGHYCGRCTPSIMPTSFGSEVAWCWRYQNALKRAFL